ncbi:MAG TPA: hypothetical protein VNZ06_08955, partial [Steroidobacteraceae bacterium]|nr:hypothetical protein [Steroidobacteraceae bacterium]
NVPLWWQLYRLRHALEVDCDARVLDAGHDLQAYGEALIAVGQQRSAFIGAVAAMAESRTLLERRIEVMTARTHRRWTYGFALASILALSVAAAATQVTAPEAPASQQQISVDATTLDRYVGNYQLGQRLLSVTRDGAQLSVQVSGQPKLPVYPETASKFFWKIADIQMTFDSTGTGPSMSASIHQAGEDVVVLRVDEAAASRLAQQLEARSAAQQPQQGSEAALRKYIQGLESGTPDYDEMAPLIQSVTRRQLPLFQGQFARLGPIASVEFKGVSPQGMDMYVVTHEGGQQSQWIISVNADGKIAEVGVLPRF